MTLPIGWREQLPATDFAPNLVVVPRALAFDFLLFCQRNPKPCPLLEVTEPGDPEPRKAAPGAVPLLLRVGSESLTATIPSAAFVLVCWVVLANPRRTIDLGKGLDTVHRQG